MWDALSPLFFQKLDADWSSDVVAVDTSPWGLGAVRATAPPSSVADVRRICERWRFGGKNRRLPPRLSALAAAEASDLQQAAASFAARLAVDSDTLQSPGPRM